MESCWKCIPELFTKGPRFQESQDGFNVTKLVVKLISKWTMNMDDIRELVNMQHILCGISNFWDTNLTFQFVSSVRAGNKNLNQEQGSHLILVVGTCTLRTLEQKVCVLLFHLDQSPRAPVGAKNEKNNSNMTLRLSINIKHLPFLEGRFTTRRLLKC